MDRLEQTEFMYLLACQLDADISTSESETSDGKSPALFCYKSFGTFWAIFYRKLYQLRTSEHYKVKLNHLLHVLKSITPN